MARAWLRRWLRQGMGAVRVLFLGATSMRGRLLETFDAQPELGLQPVGQVVDEDPDGDSDGSSDDSGRHLRSSARSTRSIASSTNTPSISSCSRFPSGSSGA